MATILILSKNEKNLELMARFLSKQGYNSILTSSYENLEKIIIENRFDLALLDIAGFDSRIWNYCERINKIEKPFFIISPIKNPKINHEGLKKGAKGILEKPLVMKELIDLINVLLK